LDEYLKQFKTGKDLNGFSNKKLKTSFGEYEIQVPRERESFFQSNDCSKKTKHR
jgi:hypothetical protein